MEKCFSLLILTLLFSVKINTTILGQTAGLKETFPVLQSGFIPQTVDELQGKEKVA